jgi:hypothetical protein
MSIIRDCENRKKVELGDQNQLLQNEIQKYLNEKKRAESLE